MGADQPRRQIRRFAHPGRALAFVLVTLLIGLVAFVLGSLVRSPDASVLDAREQSVVVNASVESRVVSDGVRIQGETMGAVRQPINVDSPDGAAFAVVTSTAVEDGAELPDGTLLGTVSDRPVFVFSLEVPLFRDLHRGDIGTDVTNLQAALGTEQTGEVDGSTLDGVRQLYAMAKIDPPGGSGYNTFIKLSEFYSVPQADQLRLVTIAAVGSRLGTDTPFAILGSGAPYVLARASVSEASQIITGSPVTVQRSGQDEAQGVVSDIGDFESKGTEAGRPPGRDIIITVPAGTAVTPGEPVSIIFGVAGEPQLAVPTLAIRSDSQGDYVLVDEAADPKTVRVAVDVIRNAQGWTAIDTEELIVGDHVRISG